MSTVLELWQSAPNGEQLLKALENDRALKQQETAKPKSAFIDPYNVYGLGGTRAKQAVINYRLLRQMATVPPVAAILLTRLNQVARFTNRPRFEGDIGFQIIHKNKTKKMTNAQRRRAVEIEEFFLKTGWANNKLRKDNFNAFVRKIVRDTLVLDAMTFELVPNLKGELAEIWAIDAETIELVANAPVGYGRELPVYEPMTKDGLRLGSDNIAYVQRINGEIVAEYSEEQLAYAVRNPRTDILLADFGHSELEVLIEIVTGILNGIRYNTTYFTHNHVPQGVLSIIGKYDDEHLEAFKRHWRVMTSGAAGKWAAPVIAVEDGQGINWTPFKQSNQDMQFNEFLEFLFNIACAVYQIDPNEVGFKSWTSSRASLTSSDNTAERMERSQDKGFVPLMNFLANVFNHEILPLIDDEFEFTSVGLDEQDQDKKLERQVKQLGSGIITVAEARKADDRDELINPATGKPWIWTQAPANPQLLQVFMAESGLNQPQGGPGAQGSEDGEGAEDQDQRDAQQSGEQDEQQDKDPAEASHERELEKMERRHELELEQKKLEHEHQMELEKLRAEARQQKVNKSLTETADPRNAPADDEAVEISITWSDY